jgi:methionyl-tRNA formyltransferase
MNKIIFIGTSKFAVPTLESLAKNENVLLVITQPDSRQGRGLQEISPPVKIRAQELNLSIAQPSALKDKELIAQITNLSPDFIVVASYGKFLPKELIEIPKYKSINVHPSLLPKYRGAAPIQWSIINGENITGVSIIYIAEKMDSGDILLQKEINIDESDNYETLSNKLSQYSTQCVLETIDGIIKNKLLPQKQDESKVCFAPKIEKKHCLINWENSANQINNLIRALDPEPCAFTYLNNKIFKIYSSKIKEGNDKNKKPGISLGQTEEGVLINTGRDSLILKEVQMEGKKIIHSLEFIKGFRNQIQFTNEK